jgi:hypothetical protein
MQPGTQTTSPDDPVPLQTATAIDDQLVSANIIPTNQLLCTVSNNSLSPATTTTCSSNDSSTNTSTTVAETRPSIIPPSVSHEENKQQNEIVATNEASIDVAPLPSIQTLPHINEKKLSTASAAPLLQHVLPVMTHQPLADIKDLETALSTTLGIHRSVSVAPNFPPFPHVTSTPDSLNALADHPNAFTTSILQHRIDNNQTHHEEPVVESIDPHPNLFNATTNGAPRFSVESSRPTSIHSPILDQELCENCQVPLMDNRVFCGLNCAQSFALMQV